MGVIINYIINKLNDSSIKSNVINSANLDAYDQLICDVLDEYRHIAILCKKIDTLTKNVEELKNKTNELTKILNIEA